MAAGHYGMCRIDAPHGVRVCTCDELDALPYPEVARSATDSQDLQTTVIGMAIGEASMCWSNIEAAGEFDSQRAVAIVDKLAGSLRALTRNVPDLLPTERQVYQRLDIVGFPYGYGLTLEDMRKAYETGYTDAKAGYYEDPPTEPTPVDTPPGTVPDPQLPGTVQRT